MADTRLRTVLIADADAALASRIATALEPEGYEIVHARDGREMAARLRDRLPDLLVLDIRLPLADGWNIVARLHEDPVSRDMPVVLLVTDAQEADVWRGWELGIATFGSKNLEAVRMLPRELRAKIRRIFKSIDEDSRRGLRRTGGAYGCI